MINSLDTKSRMAERLSIPQLQAAIQNGTIPSFIGIPLLNEKVTNAQKAKMAAQRTQQQQQGPKPTIADQVMQQAQATAGIPALPTNLSDEESYANGGIVAFAGGGTSMSDMASQYLSDEDDDEMDYVRAMLAGMGEDEYPEEEESSEEEMPEEEMGTAGMSARSISMPMITQYMRESATAKEEGAPAQTVGREKEAVYTPAGGISPEMLRNIKTEQPATGVDDSLLKHVLHKESRGQRYDKDNKLLTSPKGAQGEMQVMPKTQMKPGFGVRPAQDNSPDEMARVGRDYLKAMQARYKEDKLAAIAYNWGPGNTDKWLMDGADPRELPAETRKYIQGLAGGGIASIKHFQYGGISGTSPFDIKSLGVDDLKRMAAMGEKSAIDELVKRQGTIGSKTLSGLPRAAAPTPPPPPAPSVAGRVAGVLGRAAMPLGIAATGYDIGSKVMEGKQAEELEQYGPEPEPTAEELQRASRPSFGATTSRKKQQELGIKPLAPLTYTPAGVETYGPRPNYTPPVQSPPGATNIISPTTGGRTGSAELPASLRGQENYKQPAEDEFKDIFEGAHEAVAQEKSDLAFSALKNAEGKEEGEVKKQEGGKELSGLEKLLAERSAASKQQREIDNYMALLSAGLGMMGGTSPYAAANIGQGAQQGISTFQRSAAQRGQEERDILSGQLAIEKYGPLREIQREQIAARERQNQATLEARGNKDREAIRLRSEGLMQKQNIADAKRLDKMLELYEKRLIAGSKTAFTEADKEKLKAQAHIDLLGTEDYRKLYAKVNGFDPVAKGSILDYDIKTRSLR